MSVTSDSNVFYHNGDPDDPLVDDPNQPANEADWTACYACDCGPDDLCRCTCHATRRYH